MHLKARYRAEIRDLRELNTYLMNGSIAEGKFSFDVSQGRIQEGAYGGRTT